MGRGNRLRAGRDRCGRRRQYSAGIFGPRATSSPCERSPLQRDGSPTPARLAVPAAMLLRQSFCPLCPEHLQRLHDVIRRSRPHPLQNLKFYFENPLTPIATHAIPYTPMDGCGRWGELQPHLSGAPCRASVGERWGKKWHVSVHLREQGRPQGASFSAGDLSRLVGYPALSRHRRVPVVQIIGTRR